MTVFNWSSKRSLLSAFAGFGLTLLSVNCASAQTFPPSGGSGPTEAAFGTEHIERQNVTERLQALGSDLFGDAVDLNTGSVSFEHLDVSIPGNSGLEVAIRRSRGTGFVYPHIDAQNSTTSQLNTRVSNAFGDWSLEAPRMSIVAPSDGTQLCNSDFGDAQFVTRPGYNAGIEDGNNIWVNHYDISNGLDLIVPGAGTQKVLGNPAGVNWPAGTIRVTKDYWALSCIQKSGFQGFKATAPNGNVYKFDKLKYRYATSFPVNGQTGYGSDQDTWATSVYRRDVNLLASEVTDVHGNWVKYEYGQHGLTRIHSNDLREITLTYDSIGLVQTVTANTANTRTWQYQYTSHGPGKKALSKVILPDNREWGFDLSPHVVSANPNSGAGCTAPDSTWNMTHPSGMTGAFTFSEEEMVVSNPLGNTNRKNCLGKIVPSATYDVMALKTKTLSGSGFPAESWAYEYGLSSWGEVTDPVGTRMRTTYHSGATNNLEKLPSKSETFAANGALVSKTDYTHVFENSIGTTWLDNTNQAKLTRPRHTTKTITSQDEDTFTSKKTFNSSQSASSYSYGAPVTTRTYSNVNTTPRGHDTAYTHKTAKWILSLPSKIDEVSTSNASREVTSYVYDSNGRLTSQTRYGQPWRTLTYHTSGNAAGRVKTVTDPLGRVTHALDWKRGVPQRIKRADNLSEYQYVDENGWLTSQKDALNRTTGYTHDVMGRLTKINPTGNWLNTNISYGFPSTGGVVQTISKGQGKTTVNYDAMHRSVLERTQALDTGWSSYVNTQYDALGRTLFKSQPSTNSAESKGVNYTYDPLGRPLTEAETVSPYATTTHSYHNSHKHKVTDPSGAWMDYYAYGYGGPGNTDYRAMYHSSGQKIYIYQNQYGQTYRIRQFGTQPTDGTMYMSQFLYYNNQQRVCRHYTREGGATKYEYNLGGEMIRYAKGQSNSGCSVPNNDSRVSQTYDVLGRPKITDFKHSGTPDISRTYDANSNVKSVIRAGVNWTYTYNDVNLLTNETLSVDGLNFPLNYTYNSSQNMTSRSYPTGVVTTFEPDGLGRATAAKYDGTYRANNITYHASGAIAGLTYGNGQSFTQTLNNRLLPQRLEASGNGVTALDLSYVYDPRAKITSVTDGADSGNNRAYGYDALGRLTSASGPWGSGSTTYNVLNNVRTRTVGSRSITVNYDTYKNRATQSVDSLSSGSGGTGTRTVAYDSRGNVTSLGNLAMYYDYSDQPTSISGTANGVGAANGSYLYDGNLKRVRSIVNSKTIYNVYDSSGKLVHVHKKAGAGQSLERSDYITAGGKAIARAVDNGTIHYTFSDHLGSPVTTMSGTSNVVQRERYTPFGITMNNPSVLDDQAGFTGHIKDKTTGLNYMQARYYDPVMGRFLSVDPVTFMDTGNPGMFNRYAYTMNDPLNFIDPDGNQRRGLFRRGAGGTIYSSPGVQIRFEAARSRNNQLSDIVFGEGAPRVTPTYKGTINIRHVRQLERGNRVLENHILNERSGRIEGESGGPGEGKRFPSEGPQVREGMEGIRCTFCKQPTTNRPGRPNSRERDHSDARSQGGNNSARNENQSCRTCNRRKGILEGETFRQKFERELAVERQLGE